MIGGGEIYAAAIGRRRPALHHPCRGAPEGDTRFPGDRSRGLASGLRGAVPAGEKDSAATTFVVYERVAPASHPVDSGAIAAPSGGAPRTAADAWPGRR